MTQPPPGAALPEHPDRLWRNPEPKRGYEVVVIGAGGHGLATAHYLARRYGITDVAVLEATIHLLDVVAAVGGDGPPPDALEFVGALLARLPDPVAFIEAATGRGATAGVLPVLR